jgi:hypothetical protein
MLAASCRRHVRQPGAALEVGDDLLDDGVVVEDDVPRQLAAGGRTRRASSLTSVAPGGRRRGVGNLGDVGARDRGPPSPWYRNVPSLDQYGIAVQSSSTMPTIAILIEGLARTVTESTALAARE